jgi:alpha-1,6-mannosyltransferase
MGDGSNLPARLLALLALGGVLAASWLLAAGFSARVDYPYGGPLHAGGSAFSGVDRQTALVALGVCYLVVIGCGLAGVLPRVPAIVTLIAAQLLFALSAIAPGQDLFTYLGFARLARVHDTNPYVHGLIAARVDPVFDLAATSWRRTTTPYGPLFTLGTMGLTPLPVAVAAWTLKGILAAAMFGCCALVGRIARELDRDPTLAVVFFGLNPAVLVYALGKGHNDALMMLPVLVAIWLLVRRRDLSGGASVVLAVGVKATAAVMLPVFALAARNRRRIALGVGAAALAVAAISFAAFGVEPIHTISDAGRDQQLVRADLSFIGLLGRGVGADWSDLADAWGIAIFASAYVCVLIAAARRPGEWIRWSGWAMVALLVSSGALFPWYLTWVAPLAALARDRTLQAATLVLTAAAIWLIAF